MSIKEFYSLCDTVVSNWMSPNFTSTPTFKNDPFLQINGLPNKKLLKYTNLMPELFWGNPEEQNLAVILNLNPGFGSNDDKCIGRNTLTTKRLLNNGYSEFAKTNPYCTNPIFHPDASKWWQSRVKWLRTILKSSSGYPFIMELCPWHSKNWGEVGVVDFTLSQEKYIDENVLTTAAYAAENSISGIIFSIGKSYTNILPKLKFELRCSWGPQTPNWPLNPKGNPKQVYFEYYRKDIDGDPIKILTIWMKGGNKTPGKCFVNIEKKIIEHIQQDK